MSTVQGNTFVYQQRNQNFPQHSANSDENENQIGKILTKYKNRKVQQTNQYQKQQNIKNFPVHSGIVLNYSQIYNDLKMDRSPREIEQRSNKANKIQNNDYKQQNKQISKQPFHFQSALEIGSRNGQANKKYLPGLIVKTPKHSQVSFLNKDQSFQQSSTKPRVNRQFRISEIKDRNEKKLSIQEISDLSININGSQMELQSLNQQLISNKNTQRSYLRQQPLNDESKDSRISEERVLGNSRSVGVGNHRIQKKDLQYTQQINSQINTPQATPKTQSIKNSPRYIEQKYEQIQQIYQSKQQKQQPETSKKNKKHSTAGQQNPQKIDIQISHIEKVPKENKSHNDGKNFTSKNQVRSNLSQYQQKSNKSSAIQTKTQNKNRREILNNGKRKDYQMSQNLFIKKENLQKKQEDQRVYQGKIMHFEEKQISKTFQFRQQKDKNGEKTDKQFQKSNKSSVSNKQANKNRVEKTPQKQLKQSSKQGPINSIQVSRVASTIRVKEEAHEVDNLGELNLQPIVNDQISRNVLDQLQKQEQPEQQAQQERPKQQKPHEQINKQDYVSAFNIEQYTLVYEVLKSIQNALKASVINVQQLLKCIKKYLQIIASGGLDNIDQFDLPLHKKKILKNSLFLERVSIIVLAFTYTTHSVKQSLKYLLNIMGYSINNCLILVKILQQTQVHVHAHVHENKKIQKNTLTSNNPVIQKSDRLVMKRNLDTLRNNNNVLLDAIQKLSKGEEVFYQNLSQIVKIISKSSLEQTFYNLLEYFAFYLCVSQLDHMIPFLAVAPNPYLSPTLNSGKYTLVVDVVQIFCLGTKKSKTNIFRPYTQHFLSEMSQYFDIISFSPMFPNQIDKIIDMLDPKGHITHRLYKHHTINNNKQNLKYLDRIGRNIEQMILLDNQNLGGIASYENCIHVPNWRGSKNDTILAELCPLLAMIALKKIPVTQACRKVRQQSIKNKKQGVKYINFGISLD